MSPQTASKPRKHRVKPSTAGKPKPSLIVVYGSEPRAGRVERALQGLDVAVETTTEQPAFDPRDDAILLGIVVVTPLANQKSVGRVVSAIRDEKPGLAPPIFVVVENKTSDRGVRQVYAAGATAVFHWPREALLLPRLLAELLGIALVRGRAKGPEVALGRTLHAYLRLTPWSTSGVRATARAGGEVHLSGSVATYWRKVEVERLVRRIPGVTRIVSDTLYVEPTGRSDRQVARSIRSTLRNTTAVDHKTVAVAVRDGIAELSGTMADRREGDRILELVSNVTGVRGLRDSLVVSTSSKSRDSDTARRLNGMLSKWFPRERVTIRVFAKVAVVSGTVRGLSRRFELEQFVGQDPGVVRVVNKLDVQ